MANDLRSLRVVQVKNFTKLVARIKNFTKLGRKRQPEHRLLSCKPSIDARSSCDANFEDYFENISGWFRFSKQPSSIVSCTLHFTCFSKGQGEAFCSVRCLQTIFRITK